MTHRAFLAGLVSCAMFLVAPPTFAAWQNTGWVDNVDIHVGNGVTYVSGFTTVGNCQYNRLELRENGDYWGKTENGKRIYALILAARMAGKKIALGYSDTDGPACRIEGVNIQW
jgi:hypothetical protein